MPRAQDILREFFALNQRRATEGITPLEYQHWIHLSAEIQKEFPDQPPPGQREETRIRVEFRDYDALREAAMLNVRPIGIFVNTPFAIEVGTKLDLVAHVKENGEEFRSSVKVVSSNVGPDFSTAILGMGLRFIEEDCELRRLLDRLCGVER